ncbi:MAG: serine protease [Bacteriovoracia bacterium]
MLSKIIDEAREYTRPIVILYRMKDGRVESNIGTFFHIDDLGHILSASHIFKKGSEDPIIETSLIFDDRYSEAQYVADDPTNDIVLIKIKNYKPGSIKTFPKFLNSLVTELPRGTTLVRLGYPRGEPYSHIPATWDEKEKCFILGKNVRVTCYHNEGTVIDYVDRESDFRLIEISSPALMGQSGGPILTHKGIVVGLQSRNTGFGLPTKSVLETGLAISHIAIARFLEKIPTVRPTWA